MKMFPVGTKVQFWTPERESAFGTMVVTVTNVPEEWALEYALNVLGPALDGLWVPTNTTGFHIEYRIKGEIVATISRVLVSMSEKLCAQAIDRLNSNTKAWNLRVYREATVAGELDGPRGVR